MEHCFDALRQVSVFSAMTVIINALSYFQFVQCNADSTPLYTFGDNTAGDGQMHRCRDWEQLRTFATENTACHRDSVEEIPLGEHFGFCDNGDDGVF